jgi:membrane associated rhomboid family serine protease
LEAQTDTQTYIERGRQALAQGQPRDAAIAYAHAAQQEPDNPLIHLGLAEANLALHSYGVVHMACKKVQELQPDGGYASSLAQALLDTLDRRYDRASQNVDAALALDPTDPYAHALRGYLLRARGQDYDAGLARARAARLSYGGRFEGAFPPIEQPPTFGYGPQPTPPVNGAQPGQGPVTTPPPGTVEGNAQREAVPTWSRPNAMQRQVVRTRFALSQRTRLVTYIIIGINVLIYLVMIIVSLMTGQPVDSLGGISNLVIFNFGGQVNAFVTAGQFWRIFTAMWLHFNILHIGLNMLSLFFIGTIVEMFYGKWRYLLIYLLSGIIGGLVTYFAIGINDSSTLLAGASGAIFGVFGALGIFFLLNRRAMGPAGNAMIMNWLFWLVLNFAFDFTVPGIGIQDHIGGLAAGLILGFIFLPRRRQRPGPRRV